MELLKKKAQAKKLPLDPAVLRDTEANGDILCSLIRGRGGRWGGLDVSDER